MHYKYDHYHFSVHDDIDKSLTFGATLLRLYHHLGMPDRAYRLYKDPVSLKLVIIFVVTMQ